LLPESRNRNEQPAVAKPIHADGEGDGRNSEDDESLCACVCCGEEKEEEEKALGKRKRDISHATVISGHRAVRNRQGTLRKQYAIRYTPIDGSAIKQAYRVGNQDTTYIY
jgi:hypothetical protein